MKQMVGKYYFATRKHKDPWSHIAIWLNRADILVYLVKVI